MEQIRFIAQNKEVSKLEHLLICNNVLVRQVDYRWNQFLPSLHLLHIKLEKYGFTIINGEVRYPGDG